MVEVYNVEAQKVEDIWSRVKSSTFWSSTVWFSTHPNTLQRLKSVYRSDDKARHNTDNLTAAYTAITSRIYSDISDNTPDCRQTQKGGAGQSIESRGPGQLAPEWPSYWCSKVRLACPLLSDSFHHPYHSVGVVTKRKLILCIFCSAFARDATQMKCVINLIQK